MTDCRILDGAAIAAQIRAEVAARVEAFTTRADRKPGLAIVLVGERPDSQIYVRSKLKMADDAGLDADVSTLPATASLQQVLDTVARLNASPFVDAVLVQPIEEPGFLKLGLAKLSRNEAGHWDDRAAVAVPHAARG